MPFTIIFVCRRVLIAVGGVIWRRSWSLRPSVGAREGRPPRPAAHDLDWIVMKGSLISELVTRCRLELLGSTLVISNCGLTYIERARCLQSFVEGRKVADVIHTTLCSDHAGMSSCATAVPLAWNEVGEAIGHMLIHVIGMGSTRYVVDNTSQYEFPIPRCCYIL